MKILSLDTSTKILTMAISEDREVIFESERCAENECNKFLFPMLEEMFKKTGLSLAKIDLFAVGIGPGSFTGTRIAVTAMKGFAYAQSKPIIGVSSLDIIAHNLRGEVEGLICPLIDAKRGNLYTAIYRKRKENPERISNYLLISPEELVSRLDSNVFFLGDGLNLYRKEILRKIPRAKIATYNLWYPKGGNLGIIAYERFKEGKRDSVFDLVPMYLYPKECSVTIKSKS